MFGMVRPTGCSAKTNSERKAPLVNKKRLSRLARDETVQNQFFPGTARQGRCAANYANFRELVKKSV